MTRWAGTPRKRVVVLALAGWLVVLFALQAIAVPYVRLSPGPVFDVLGQSDGQPVISIRGAEVHPTTGRLDMTTVSERGGPFGGLTLFEAYTGWLDPAVAVVPTYLLYPPDTSGEQAKRLGADQFSDSQENARIAALREVGEPVRTRPWVREVIPGTPAEGVLKHGDVVLSADGRPLAGPEQLARVIGRAGPGSTVTLEVRRDRAVEKVVVETIGNPLDPAKGYVGVSLGVIGESPVQIDFHLQDVGGPSAGLIFSLGIVDKLTPGGLLSERTVAGTGTMSADGRVGPVGGVRQKLAAAASGGATLFLVPAANCDQVSGGVPDGLEVAAVQSLAQAR
ncbi:MAG TPA: PDZ domain-containing protein, partial [Actinomycetota bacterium]|nr:PDZ domain-containing protein [Actinomycetota bacterium]